VDFSALRRPKFYNFSQFEMEHSFVAPFLALQEIRLNSIVMRWLVKTYFVAKIIILDYNLEK